MYTLTFTDGRVAHADSLTAFMDEHFPPGLDIDAIWTGPGGDGGSILILLPREEGHAFIALSHIEGDGRSIGAAEADRIRLGLAPDPFDVEGPATNHLRDRLDRFLFGTGITAAPRGSTADAAAWALPHLPPTHTTQEPKPVAATSAGTLDDDPLHQLAARQVPQADATHVVDVALSDGRHISGVTVRDALARLVGADVDPVWISDRGGRDLAQLGRIDEHGRFTSTGLTITDVRVAGKPVPSDEIASLLGAHARGSRTPTSELLFGHDAPAARLQRLTDRLGADTPAVRPAAPTPPIGRQL